MILASYPTLWPLLLYVILAIALPIIMLVLSYFLGERHLEDATQEPFESGIKTTDSARMRFSIHFYAIAMFFVIFDLEVVFIVSWAVAAKEVGWVGYIAVFTFILDLLAVLIYLWRIGALDFGPDGKKILKAYHKLKTNKI
ncbi:MAG TPA: NADH-quinone oxidoreductase subunit A [Flavobacteriaceae bacterium]|nr:NADH-quinone oxidoreductase subunit A [Flavobacteriaceae bacterium]